MLRSSVPSIVALGTADPDDSGDGVLSRKFLGMVSPGGAFNVQFYFRFSVLDPVAKFALEPAKCGGGLVNVRCCYNNLYWSRPFPNTTTIIAEASEPVEDKSSYKCTLFKPNLIEYDGQPAVQFLHVETGRNLVLYWSDSLHYRFLMVSQSDSESETSPLTSILIDYDSLVILPKRVIFRGSNKKFLQASSDHYPQFTQDDPESETVVHQVFTTSDGLIQIKSSELGKYWRRSADGNSDWIKADVDKINGDFNDDPNTFFQVVKAGGDATVALRNFGNKHFCKRLTMDGKQDCVNANALSMISDAQFEVHEPVVSRLVKEVTYRLDGARVFGVEALSLAESDAVNRGNTDSQIQLQFERTVTRSRTWGHNIGVKAGVKTEFKTGVPFIAEGKIEVSAEGEYGYNWGTTEETSDKISTTHTVTVPPKSRVTVRLLATKGTCEVPFTYTQVDRLYNGDVITSTMDDGVFSGVDYYSFHHTSSAPEPLPAAI
ncbi:unnamed protein product [Cuscuta campestris]|uniref:Agglutinin domain-containing protein n=1 Tax=Cuscuta campestris TaxID=132261 RepID=A0A484KNJ0_9ASTE|nr:unnamed protein product [Cuscuta campestris]